MAALHANGLKRPYPGEESETAQKKARSVSGSPAPQHNGHAAAGKQDVNKIMAEARAKATALAARLQGSKLGQAEAQLAPSANALGNPSAISSSVQAKIAEMKARVAAATAKANSTPQIRSGAPTIPGYQAPPLDDGTSRARGGLDVGLHPALMGDSSDSRSPKGRQAIAPKFATTMANRRAESPLSKLGKGKRQLDLSGPSAEETRSNPYFDPSLGPQTVQARNRNSRQLIFNQKGKYIQQATALRRQAALEAMKKRIAESSRKAGIDEDLDTEKAYLVPSPPDIEWWDEGLVKGKDYSNADRPSALKVDTSDSIVTVYIQHPVALQPPQEKNLPPPKPMFLTPQEQKKIRRQRRMGELKEKQDKIRLGLEPAPPPKVKKSNLMRVLGEEAVRDPTAVEARVNREIAERFDNHMATNEARALTKDQKHEKLANQQAADAAKGIHATVYKIDSLANGRHRFKISKNAEQHALTGICILHPKFCLVAVEGGIHSIAAYKKLMMNRIDWTENSAPNSAREGNKETMASWLEAQDEKGMLKDLGSNSCQLVWEGEQKTRAFRKWGSRVCETDKEARDALSRAKMESFWTVAKNLAGTT